MAGGSHNRLKRLWPALGLADSPLAVVPYRRAKALERRVKGEWQRLDDANAAATYAACALFALLIARYCAWLLLSHH